MNQAGETVDVHEAAEALIVMPDDDEPEVETQEPEAEAPEEPAAEAEAGDAAEETKEPEPETPAEPEEWAKTAEGIAAKAAEVQKQLALVDKERGEFQKRYDQLERRERKLRDKVDKFKESKGQSDSMVRWFQTNLQAIRNGDAATKLQALGAIAGMSGADFYEQLSLGLASDGKLGAENKEMRELREQLATVQRELKQRSQHEGQRTQAEELAAFRSQVLDLAKTSESAVCKAIAERAPDLFQDEAQRIAVAFRKSNGRPIDRTTLLGKLEERLKALSPADNGAAPSDGGTDLDTVANAKPGTARRSPKAQSISQSAGGNAPRRALTPEERRKRAEELVDLVPD